MQDLHLYSFFYEVVTSLCSVLYAHGGSKLRLVLIMDQPHLRNPF